VTVIRATEAPRFELPGVEFTGLAAPSRGSTDVCTWQIIVAPGFVSPEPHTLDRDEIFMVTEGALRMTPGGERLGPGDAVVVPAGSPILLVNPGDRPARAFVAIGAGFAARADPAVGAVTGPANRRVIGEGAGPPVTTRRSPGPPSRDRAGGQAVRVFLNPDIGSERLAVSPSSSSTGWGTSRSAGLSARNATPASAPAARLATR